MIDTCEHSGTRGKCPAPIVAGSKFCAKHSDEQARIKGYILTNPELRDQFEHHQQSDLYESLRQEIDLLRATIQIRVNSAKNSVELASLLSVVHKPLVDLTKCMETLSKLQRQNNIVLGQEALAWLQKKIIDILVSELEHIPSYEPIVDSIASKLAGAIANAKNQE